MESGKSDNSNQSSECGELGSLLKVRKRDHISEERDLCPTPIFGTSPRNSCNSLLSLAEEEEHKTKKVKKNSDDLDSDTKITKSKKEKSWLEVKKKMQKIVLN